MTRFAAPLALCAVLVTLGAAPAAAQMQPGLWRFTQTTQANGKTNTRTTTRCVTETEARDPVSYFQPHGEGCALTSNSTWGGRITSTLRCVQGDETSDVTTTVHIMSPVQLSITSVMGTSSRQGRATISLTGSGERIGECNEGGERKERNERKAPAKRR